MLAILLAGTIFSAAQDIEDRIQNLYAQSAANEKNGNLEEAIKDYREIIKLNRESQACLPISSEVGVAPRADRICVLRDGRLRERTKGTQDSVSVEPG
jgi:tetratricopeptide (TPR) repeat protein